MMGLRQGNAHLHRDAGLKTEPGRNMFHWLEKRIDPFAPFDETEMPPTSVGGFSWYYLRPIRFWLGVLFVASLLVGIFESSLYILIGWIVDLLATSAPDRLW